MIFLLLLAAYVPALVWLWFFYSRDRYGREPRQLLLNLFLLGLGATVPALAISAIVSSVFATQPPPSPVGVEPALGLSLPPTAAVVITVLLIAFVQEVMKLGFAWTRVRGDPNFDEPVDGMIYLASTALGFAAALTATPFADAAYAVTAFGAAVNDATVIGVVVTALLGVMTALAHASFSGIAGYFVSAYVLRRRSLASVAAGVALATALNAAYAGGFRISEGLVGAGLVSLAPSALALLVSLTVFATLFRAALRQSPGRRAALTARQAMAVPSADAEG